MWLAMIALSLFAMGLIAFGWRPRLATHRRDLGVMSQQWLSEHRAGSR
jgi:hypothetical protein